MAKYTYIPVDIYKRGITVFIGSHKEFKSWVRDYYKNDEDYQNLIDYVCNNDTYNTLGVFWYNGSTGDGIIELPRFPKSAKEIAVAAHEVLHAVFHILDYCGVNYSKESGGESHTYLLEYMLSNLLNIDNYKIV